MNSLPHDSSTPQETTEPIFNPWLLSRDLTDLELLEIVYDALMGCAFLDNIRDAVDEVHWNDEDYGTVCAHLHLLSEVLDITRERLAAAADSGEAG